MAKFSRGDRVVGWFGKGIVTDAPTYDNVVRVMYRKSRRPVYRYVLAADIDKVS